MRLKLQLRSRRIAGVRVAEAAFGCRLAAVPPATKTPPKPSVAAPERSLVQRMEALERANKVRTRRAQLKRDLKAGRSSIHDLLLEPPEYVETAKVFDMLLAVPKYGRVKVNKVLVQCRISPSKTIGGLSQRQRTERVWQLRLERPRGHLVARVFVITGPSGVGKGTLIRSLRERMPELELSVSATTRAPRPGEHDGVDYHFLSDADFQRRVDAGDFVEHAVYADRRYGTLRSELERRTAAGHPVVLEIELQGARQVRAALPDAVQVFIAPPSLDALRARLIGRGTDDEDEVAARLRVAESELAAQGEFRHVVVNDRLEDAVEQLVSIVAAELQDPVKSA